MQDGLIREPIVEKQSYPNVENQNPDKFTRLRVGSKSIIFSKYIIVLKCNKRN